MSTVEIQTLLWLATQRLNFYFFASISKQHISLTPEAKVTLTLANEMKTSKEQDTTANESLHSDTVACLTSVTLTNVPCSPT